MKRGMVHRARMDQMETEKDKGRKRKKKKEGRLKGILKANCESVGMGLRV